MNVEEIYSGIPVIATDNRGHRELVKDGENGYIIKDLDKIMYKEKLKKLVNDFSLRKDMGEKSKEMSQKYIINNVIKDVEKIYKEIM